MLSCQRSIGSIIFTGLCMREDKSCFDFLFTPPLLLLLPRLVKVRTSFSWISISTADFALKRACFDVTRVEKAINVLGVGEAIGGFCFVASAFSNVRGELNLAHPGVLWSLSFSVFRISHQFCFHPKPKVNPNVK